MVQDIFPEEVLLELAKLQVRGVEKVGPLCQLSTSRYVSANHVENEVTDTCKTRHGLSCKLRVYIAVGTFHLKGGHKSSRQQNLLCNQASGIVFQIHMVLKHVDVPMNIPRLSDGVLFVMFRLQCAP